ncbi:hypothetical protein GCM10011515_00100 [Tsuneonella deserti]|uniref:Swt1-like HEPN domain-containing protein n=1 Tax=Tsuneonella deserti TaxID=2035528 RepID=A0ABQ1RWI1_9SPHN|nr:hypothetical protein [Tsuneonella deserti]GGD84329.1 hypothetical protein GCM10011515_00100 [Tsuneonella deserti]
MDADDESASDKRSDDEQSKRARSESLTAAEDVVRGLPDLAAERLARDYLESPAVKMAQDYLESPAAKLARDFANSPAQQLARQAALGLGPNFGAADTARMEAIRRALEPPAGLAAKLSAFEPIAIEQAKLGAIMPSIDPSVIKAIQGLEPLKIDPALGRAMQEAQKSLDEMMRPFGGIGSAIAHFEEQQRAVQKSLVASLAGPIGDIAKTGQWVSALARADMPDVAGLFGGSLGTALDDVRARIATTFTGAIAADQAKMSALLGLDGRFAAEFETTRLKMSALAGIGEAFGPRSSLRLDAYHSLFGEWRSRPDLPENFWRDTRVRRRMYREAEVDDGLIEASPGVALEIMIESGLTAGLRSEANAVAVFAFGEVSMTVRSRGTRKDAYAALDRFEQELRAYVARKLEERFGPDWFKARASNLIGKAKGIRKAAMERGEAFAPLIEFVELGELAGIVLNTKNWDEVFGDVFINRAEFDHDMQKLVATRRPTMHIRPIDGVRLVEMLCVMKRLSEQMTDDGAWKVAADSDR